jgi:hypothetical protein
LYINVEQFSNSPYPLVLHVRTKLLAIHMPKATCSDHPNWLLPSHSVKLKLVTWAYNQIVKLWWKGCRKNLSIKLVYHG